MEIVRPRAGNYSRTYGTNGNYPCTDKKQTRNPLAGMEEVEEKNSKNTVGANNSGQNEGRERKCLCTGSEGEHANGLFFFPVCTSPAYNKLKQTWKLRK